TPLQMISSADIGRFVAHVIGRGPELTGRRIEIAGDALTGTAIAGQLGSKIGRPVEFQVQPLEELKTQFGDMSIMYEWFERGGFSVDIAQLHREFSEVEWTSFDDWSGRQDWAELLEPSSVAANS
ncbi:MAG: NmrA family NAD(P)-binding protein, partial [Chloroflexi bacterium]|nr:NmrA family NAD(P)-binding protein [Chloroflexota bacterium]